MPDLTYNYIRISSASTPPDFTTFRPNLFANANINNDGYVDYEGFVGSVTSYLPPSAIYSGNGSSPPTTLIDPTKYQFTDNTGKTYQSGIFFSPAINNSGVSVFAGSGFDFASSEATASAPTAIISVLDGAINNVAYSSTPFVTIALDPNKSLNDPSNDVASGSFVSAPGLNDRGTVAYVAGNSDGTSAIYAKSPRGKLTTIASTSGNSPFSDFYLGGLDVGRGQGTFAKFTLPGINNYGWVVFNADLKGGGKGLFASNGRSFKTIVSNTSGSYSYFSLPSINNNGTVAFNAGYTNGREAIIESTNGNLTTIADNSSGSIFKDFKSDVAINNQGDVAFLADLKDGSTAIYSWSADSGFSKVIAVGQALDGSTVTSLFVSHKGLNDHGHVAFDAVLANGGDEVFRAEPGYGLQQNSVLSLDGVSTVGLAIFSIVSYYWRHRKGH